MIKTEVIGCVGQDAVLREIAGYTYTCFDLAVMERVKGEERTTWVRIRKFDKEQKYAQYITKGKAIYVEGRPQVSAYTNKEGNPAADMTVWADRLEFIAGAGSGGSQQQTGYAQSVQPPQQTAVQQQQYYQPQQVAAPVPSFGPEQDDLPF